VVDDEQQAGRAAEGELPAIEGELAYLRVVEGDGGAFAFADVVSSP
jgi:hypothetical protein